MSNQKNRIDTIIALINSNTAYSGSNLTKIKRELHQVVDVDGIVPPNRRNILKVLHSTRGLDTALGVFLDKHHIRNGSNTLGRYLYQLSNHANGTLAKISASERAKYQNKIVDIRNMHMHKADSYPTNESAVYELISEMQALLTRVLSL